MNHTRHSNVQMFLRIASAFLTGIIVGSIGFALWAEQAGLLTTGPLFLRMILPLGTLVGLLVAFLPLFIGEMMAAIRRANAAKRRSREKLETVVAEQSDRDRGPVTRDPSHNT